MRSAHISVVATLLFAAGIAAQPNVVLISPQVSTSEITVSLHFSGDISAQKATAQLSCEQYASEKKVNPTLTADPEVTEATDQLAYRMPAASAERADYLLCTVANPQAALGLIPKFRIDVSGPRQLADAQKRLQLKDDEGAKKYEPPKRAFFRSRELSPGRLVVDFTTPACGSVRARIKDGQIAPASALDKTHRFEFQKLAEGTKYAVEAWVVDAAGNEVANSRTDTDMQGKPLEFVIPANPGKVGLAPGVPLAESTKVTFPVAIDRDASVRVTARKVLDRQTGKYGPPKNAEQPLVPGSRDVKVEMAGLEPDSQYDYVVETTNEFGETSSVEARTVSTLPVFGFKNALEVSITPVGFLITFEATDLPETAGLRVRSKGFLKENSVTPTEKVIKLSLNLSDTQEFLKKGDGQPTLETFIRKNGNEKTQQIKVAFEPLESAKQKIQTLSLDQPEKDKLTAAVEGVAKKKWGETWGNIIPAVFKLALTFF